MDRPGGTVLDILKSVVGAGPAIELWSVSPPMNSAADEYLREHLDDANAVKWPADAGAKIDVAQTLLGVHFLANADYWFGYAHDLIINPPPKTAYVRPW